MPRGVPWSEARKKAYWKQRIDQKFTGHNSYRVTTLEEKEGIRADLLGRKMTRRAIAAKYDRSLSVVNGIAAEIHTEIEKLDRLCLEVTLAEREQKARDSMAEAARRLAAARPDGSTCTVKACPFPSLLDGKCRQHYQDSVATYSVLASNAALL